MEENIKKIEKIVNWWERLTPDYTGLNDLMHARQLLSAYMYGMATDLALARKSWGEAQAMLEKKKNQNRVKFSSNNQTSTQKADYQARANTADLFDMEKKFESLYYGMKHKYDAIGHVLEAMAQRIAILRREWEQKNFSGGA